MKTIITKAIIDSLRTHKDGSLGVAFSTPELQAAEKAIFFELQNQNVEMTIKPIDEEKPEDFIIDHDLDFKPQSVRMRNVIFLLWKQDPEGLEFDGYYKKKTEKIIDWLKGKIEQ